MTTAGVGYGQVPEEPFQVSLEEGSPGTRETVFVVPAVRLLIIEFVSANIELPQGQSLSVVLDVIRDAQVTPVVFPLLDRQSHSLEPGVIRDMAGINQLVRVYTGAGAQVDVSTVRVPTAGFEGGSVLITGNLVKVLRRSDK
jgi:hypothetical protein